MRLVATAILAVCLLGCERYEKVVYYNPPMGRLPGAQTGMQPVTRASNSGGAAQTGDGEIVIENEDGTVTLVSQNALQMLSHIRRLLAENDEALFTEQILSARTRNEFTERGYDPAEAFKELKRREKDVMKLLARMPMGEFTPGLYLEQIGQGTFRLALYGRAGEGLEWTFVDIVVERGVWRLRWFG